MSKQLKAGAEPAVSIELTKRELTLVRVACLQRLDRLKKRQNDLLNRKQDCTDITAAYEETRTLMNGKLWLAVKGLRA